MIKKNKKIITLFMILTISLTLVACNKKESKNTESKKDIKLVCMESSLPILERVKQVMERDDYNVDISLVDMNVPVMESVQDKSADGGLGIHIKFMEKYNNDNSGELAMQDPYAYYTGIGLYSNKFNKVEDIPQNARISIMHDAMNMDMGLRMLRDFGVIELDDKHNGDYSTLNITENEKNIEFIEVDQIQTIRMIDELDGAIAFFGHAKAAGIEPEGYIIRNKDGEDYPMGIVVRGENKNTEWSEDIAKAFHDPLVKDYIIKEFKGVFNFYELD